jgi:hypothetical protein
MLIVLSAVLVLLFLTSAVKASDWQCSYNNAARRASCFVSGTLQLGIANTSSLPSLSVTGVAPSTAVLLRTGEVGLAVPLHSFRFD